MLRFLTKPFVIPTPQTLLPYYYIKHDMLAVLAYTAGECQANEHVSTVSEHLLNLTTTGCKHKEEQQWQIHSCDCTKRGSISTQTDKTHAIF